ncbi:unnamed protein product [Caenorhabditis nigoni]
MPNPLETKELEKMSSSSHTTENSSFLMPSYKFQRKGARNAVKPICIRLKLAYGYDGNSAQYANNSCEPNMIVENWMVNNRKEGFQAIGFVANKNIRKGAELTINYGYDYNLNFFSGKRVGDVSVGRASVKDGLARCY